MSCCETSKPEGRLPQHVCRSKEKRVGDGGGEGDRVAVFRGLGEPLVRVEREHMRNTE